MRRLLIVLLTAAAGASWSADIPSLVKKNIKVPPPAFSQTASTAFLEAQQKAAAGDAAAQKLVFSIVHQHLRQVYAKLKNQQNLLFSVRKLEEGFDSETDNYAVNIDRFFENTTDTVRVKKRNFTVRDLAGKEFKISRVRYNAEDQSVEAYDGTRKTRLRLAELQERDRDLVLNALKDEQFGSEQALTIRVEDERLGEVGKKESGYSGYVKATGEYVSGSLRSSSSEGISRVVILENTGDLTVDNLLLEYQSFADQKIMGFKKDFPEEYCCAGYRAVEALPPGKTVQIELKLPNVVEAKEKTIETDQYEYYLNIPGDCHRASEGRMNGIRLRLHRITPFGERLTREFQSPGVPAREWTHVAPLRSGEH